MTFKFYSSFFLFFAGSALSVFSQKLPSVQENSLIAPANIRIDGKNKEWGTGFQALNKRTNLQYTICNDDKNLYLIIKSADVLNNRKILAGGITFSINTDGKKNEKESIQLTYPVITGARGGRGGGWRGQGQGQGRGNRMQESAKERDSIMAAGQRSQLAQAKEIHIKGFKNTTDSVLSIYNESGIKAFASIDGENAFFYEAAIPLEALGISKDYTKEMAYQIRLNGLQMQSFNGAAFSIELSPAGRPGGGMRGGSGFEDLSSPTDFWGKYTLALK